AERSVVGAGDRRNFESETVAFEHGIAAAQAHRLLIQAIERDAQPACWVCLDVQGQAQRATARQQSTAPIAHDLSRLSDSLASENERHRNALAPGTTDTLAIVAERSVVGAGDRRNFETETVAFEHGIAAAQAHRLLIQAIERDAQPACWVCLDVQGQAQRATARQQSTAPIAHDLSRLSDSLASENERHRNALAPRTTDTLAIVAERSVVGAGDRRNFESETVAFEHGIAAAQAHRLLIQAIERDAQPACWVCLDVQGQAQRATARQQSTAPIAHDLSRLSDSLASENER